MSTLNEYQNEAQKTNKGTTTGVLRGGHYEVIPGMYNIIGLNGEAGEAAEKVKKFARDGGDYIDVQLALKKELGDVLWYLAAVAKDWGMTLQEVADANLAKLRDRAARAVLHGSGDNR